MINLIIVGGFLGAGKTSIITRWVRYMEENGRKPGVIVNDLSNDLVDKRWFDLMGIESESVWGGCVCNTVKKLQNSVSSLEKKGIDTLFLEPVGSHLNLSQKLLPSILSSCPSINLKPVVILIDAQRLLSALQQRKEYITELIELQLLSADLLLINKIDLINDSDLREIKFFIDKYEIPAKSISHLDPRKIKEFFAEYDKSTGTFEKSMSQILPGTVDFSKKTPSLSWLSFGICIYNEFEKTLKEILDKFEKNLRIFELGNFKLLLASEYGWIKIQRTDWDQGWEIQENILGCSQEWKGNLNIRSSAPVEVLNTILLDLNNLIHAENFKIDLDTICI